MPDALLPPNLDAPKPWHIETDWTVEVIAADGSCVTKFQTRDEAEDFIKDN